MKKLTINLTIIFSTFIGDKRTLQDTITPILIKEHLIKITMTNNKYLNVLIQVSTSGAILLHIKLRGIESEVSQIRRKIVIVHRYEGFSLERQNIHIGSVIRLVSLVSFTIHNKFPIQFRISAKYALDADISRLLLLFLDAICS